MNTLELNFQNEPIRVAIIDGEPWWVAADVCYVLGLQNPRQVLADHVDEQDKGVRITDTLGGPQNAAIINESGLYTLIFKSRKEKAKEFRRWVTREVLPAIRKTGRYEAPPPVSRRVKQKPEHVVGYLSARGIHMSTEEIVEMATIAEKMAKRMGMDLYSIDTPQFGYVAHYKPAVLDLARMHIEQIRSTKEFAAFKGPNHIYAVEG